MAHRQGLELRKSRRRDPMALDYGLYWLVEPGRNLWVFPQGTGVGTDLAEIEQWLAGDRP